MEQICHLILTKHKEFIIWLYHELIFTIIKIAFNGSNMSFDSYKT